MITRILWPTDFSALSRNAAPVVNEMARRFSAPVDVLHVFSDPPIVAHQAALALETYRQAAEDQFTKNLATLVEEEIDRDVDARPHLLRAAATANAIVEFATENDIDLIVISTHGETGLTRFVFGSVAERVVRLADCSVLTVPNPADED